jgi:hypothetical protein
MPSAPSTAPTLVDPTEPPAVPLAVTVLAPRPSDVRSHPARLAARFVAEWLTYPPGPEAPSALAQRLDELVTERYRRVIAGLSAAGMENRPGSMAELGATNALDEDGVYRVTAWQRLYGSSTELVGPYAWDVTVVPDPAGGWHVDGLGRSG